MCVCVCVGVPMRVLEQFYTGTGVFVCAKVHVLRGRNPSLREPMKETGGAKTSGLPPNLLPSPQPRYLLYPGCQVVAAQQNEANLGPTRASALSTNEGVLPCTDERVQVFVCTC